MIIGSGPGVVYQFGYNFKVVQAISVILKPSLLSILSNNRLLLWRPSRFAELIWYGNDEKSPLFFALGNEGENLVSKFFRKFDRDFLIPSISS